MKGIKLILILSMVIVLRDTKTKDPQLDCPEPENIQALDQKQLVRLSHQESDHIKNQQAENKKRANMGFQDSMRWSEKLKGKDLQNRCKQLRQDLLNTINEELVELQTKTGSKTIRTKFYRANTILNFIKNAGSQNQNITQEFQHAKQQILSLIHQKIQYLNSLIEGSKIHEMYVNAYGWKVAEALIRLFNMKEIKYSPLKGMEDTISTVCNCIQSHIRQLTQVLQNTEVSNTSKFKQISTDLINLIKALEIALPAFQSKKIDLPQHQDDLFDLFTIKFIDFFEEIRQCLNQGRLYQSKSLIQILSKYKSSELNKAMKNKLKTKYDIFHKKYKKLVKAIPQKIKQLFQEEKYTEMKIQLSQYRRIQSQSSNRKVLSEIINKIQANYKLIMKSLSSLNTGGSRKFSTLRKNINKFNSYSAIVDIFDREDIEYEQKLSQISVSFIHYYESTKEGILKSIKTQKFKGIKQKIEDLNKIYPILLLGLRDQGINLKIVDIKEEYLEKKIEQLLSTNQTTQITSYFDRYEKLKILDEQYETDDHGSLKEKITQKVVKNCQQAEQTVQNTKDLNEMNKIETQLKKLKNIFIKNIKTKPEFDQVLQIIKETEQKLSNFSSTFIQNTKYNQQYLQKLKRNDMKKYTKVIEDLVEQFTRQAKIIQEAVQVFDEVKIYDGLKIIEKYEGVDKYIIVTLFESPIKYRNKILKKMEEENKRMWVKIYSQLSDKNISSIASFKKFASLQVASKGTISKEILQKFHIQNVNYLKSVIPDLPKTANLNAQLQRVQTIKKQTELIKMLKQYIQNLSISYTIDDTSNIAQYLSNLKFADQTQNQIYDRIKELPIVVQSLWNESNYRQIFNKLADLKKLEIPISKTAFQELKQQVKILIKTQAGQLRTKIADSNFNSTNQDLSKIQSAENELRMILGLKESKLSHKLIIKEIGDKIDTQIVNQAIKKVQTNLEQCLEKILELKKWTDRVPSIQDKIEQKLKSIIMKVKEKKLISPLVGLIEKKVNLADSESNEAALCNEILLKYSKQLLVPRILPKLRISSMDAIQKFKGQSEEAISKIQLNRTYGIYERQFQKQKDTYIAKGSKQSIKENLKRIKERITSLMKNIKSKRNDKEQIPQVLANIFIYWSLSKSGETFYEIKQAQKDASDYLLQPHPIQVLSILRFVGYGKKDLQVSNPYNILDFQNHIMQIKTGEGKSVILGSMGILLALMGHKVDCVSYSSYLSQRDYQDFKQIFIQLGVDDKISYGTFNGIAEKLINQKCDVRTLADNLFMPSKIKKIPKPSKGYRTRILLVDQIDTFFSRDFYGATYNPVTLLQNKQIREIIDIIWKNRQKNHESIKHLFKNSQAYKILQKEYHDCIHYIQKQFSLMIKQAKQFDSRDYIVQDGKIGYKQLDGLSFKTVYGYQTMFTYIYQSQEQRGNINKTVAESNVGVIITCGQYSYAEMIDNFDRIFGVTGTLQSLSDFQSKILSRYQINKKTFAPSVYGDSLRTELPILIENDKSFHQQKIATVIEQQLKNGRAILVFFENQKQLLEFQKSGYTQRFHENLRIVTEKTQNRNYHIKKATSPRTVTLFTAPFGRGTDFVIFDPSVEKQGTAVIQTFLSEELSEEIQIKGRTARQGKKGSYQLILNLQKLQTKYKITKDMIIKAKQTTTDSITNLLHRERVKYLQEVNKQRQKFVDQAKQIHTSSIEFSKKMQNNQISRNQQFFFKNTVVVGDKARILCMIDATGSMGDTIDQVKGKVMTMIDSLAEKYPGKFQIQLMFYYGFAAYESQKSDTSAWNYRNKIHASEWTSDTAILRKFMTTVAAGGGNNHEAIELALHHLILSNKEVGVTKGILIGDDGLADNNQSQMSYHVHPQDKHRYPGKQSTNIVQKLKISELISQLKIQGISVDTYPIDGGRTFTTFNHISTQTNGKCKSFNPTKDNLSAEIEETIKQCIVMRK